MGALLGLIPAAVGGIADLFGTSKKTPQLPNIQNPVNPAQLNQAYANTQEGQQQQQAFLQALQAQNGIGNQSSVFQQQQALAGQLGQQAQGVGPNPAQAALAQATGANTANQAALMAGQRGAGANAGLLARQAAQQGAANQQQAVGQSATLQAQQQLAAQQALMQQQQNMAGLAGQQVGQQGQALSGLNQNALAGQQAQLGAQAAYNNALTSGQGSVNAGNTQLALPGAQAGVNAAGGIASGAGQIAGRLFGSSQPDQQPQGIGPIADGSQYAKNVTTYAQGGEVGPSSNAGKYLCSGGNMAQGGSVMHHAKDGGAVPGQASVEGNSLQNDTVSAKLSPGEVVIPRSVMQSKDPASEAARFVAAIMAKKGLK